MPGHNPEKAACRAAQSRNSMYGWLNKRRDFLRAAKGARAHSACFVLQAIPSEPVSAAAENAAAISTDDKMPATDARQARFGLTVSKKNGNAVKRNRIKRRLRSALTQAFAQNAAGSIQSSAAMDVRAGYDYVVVARPEALTRSFGELVDGLQQAVKKIHTGGGKRRRQGGHSPARSDTAPIR